jgi:hypothetical protein
MIRDSREGDGCKAGARIWTSLGVRVTGRVAAGPVETPASE